MRSRSTAWPSYCAICCPRRGSRPPRCAQLQPPLLRNRIHAALADRGHDRPARVWSGPGLDWLAALELPTGSCEVVSDCLTLIEAIEHPDRPAERRVPGPRQG